jgi:predicted  nucleic acid-binding Zn-ribbon protein
MVRRFVSSKEEAEKLEQYKEQLEKEIAGIDERIDDLKKE